MKKSIFITFEGIEGCGKTTQLNLAARWLEEQGFGVRSTREPGGTEFGVQIRKILLSESSTGLNALSEALLYMADRFQHIQDVIRPSLDEGGIILCDRYHDSTIAYQGYARGISLEILSVIWDYSGIAVEPDLTLLLDLEPKVGLERSLRKLAAMKVDESRFEKETVDFHGRVRDGFLTLLQQNPTRMRMIDASKSIDSVHRQVIECISEHLKIFHETE
jgi:dTMP kinase